MTYNEIFAMLIDSFITAILLVTISMVVCYFYLKYKNTKWRNPLRFSAFLLYLYMLLYITVFRGSLFQNGYHAINLIPFDELLTSSYYQAQVLGEINGLIMLLYNVVGNIIWFIPFGLLLCNYLNHINFKKIALYSLLLSLTIEVLQYFFYTGVSDIDDLIFNVIGGMCGYLLYNLVRKMRSKDKNKNKSKD